MSSWHLDTPLRAIVAACLRPRIPNTEIWVLLYVQVMQIDGASRRNVLLSRLRAEPLLVPRSDQLHGDDVLLFGSVRFAQSQVLERLMAVGLSKQRHSACWRSSSYQSRWWIVFRIRSAAISVRCGFSGRRLLRRCPTSVDTLS